MAQHNRRGTTVVVMWKTIFSESGNDFHKLVVNDI